MMQPQLQNGMDNKIKAEFMQRVYGHKGPPRVRGPMKQDVP